MKVTHGPQDPQESKNLTLVWFFLSLFLFISFFWSVIDESVVRRPWKGYQREFNKLELKQIKEQIEAEEKRIQESHGDRLKEIHAEIQKSEKERDSAAYQALLEERNKKQTNFSETEQKRSFIKSDLDEAVYLYEHGKLLGSSPEKIQKLKARVKDLESKLHLADQELAKVEKDYLAIEKDFQEKESPLLAAAKEETNIRKGLEELIRRRENIKNRGTEIKQIVVDGLGEFGRVDRCQTCHVGINRDGFEDWPQPYTTHPRRDELFGPHPPEQFGCTACHHGQGRALSSAFKAHAFEEHEKDGKKEIHYLHHWLEPMHTEKFREASCNDCHGTQYRVPKAPEWQHATKLFVEMGCHGCHLVEGFGKLEKVGPSLNKIGSKVEPEWLVDWIEEPARYNPHTRMPNFRLSRDESAAVAAYLLEVSDKNVVFSEPFEGGGNYLANQGKEIFETVGCQGCHVLGEDSRKKYDEYRESKSNDPPVTDHGPDLSRVGEKIKPQWLTNWIKNPRELYPHTRMPSLRLGKWEVRSVTAYLLTFGQPTAADEDLRHRVKDPEVIEQGRKLIQLRGCYGCHDIKGFENSERIGPELSNFSNKTLEEMVFGSTLDKNAPEPVEETWEDFTRNKLKKPDVFDTETIHHIMPTFPWRSEEEIEKMLLFLKGQDRVYESSPWRVEMTAQRQAVSRGQYLTARYNCNACHLLEDMGGTIRAFHENKNMWPPNLKATGAKLQSEWLYRFLHQPSTVRPWLNVRMPSFQLSEQEYTELVKYFEALDGVKEPYHDLRFVQTQAGGVEKGQNIFKANDCLKCHVLGNSKAAIPQSKLNGTLAPNLRLVRERLRPDWIPIWLADPGAIVPGTEMTAFWSSLTQGEAADIKDLKQLILATDDPDEKASLQSEIDEFYARQEVDRAQVQYVRDYLLSLGR